MATIVMPVPSFFPRRLSSYVPSMQYADVVNQTGSTRITFGAPGAASAVNIFNVSAISAGAITTLDATGVANAQTIDAPWGRLLQLVASTTNVTVAQLYGADYLGQSIREDVTLVSTTPVVTKKAFKWLDTIIAPANAGTISVGWAAGLGLPYKTISVTYEIGNGVKAAAGTFVAAVLTDPQTATTGDPRGTYITTTTLNGSNIISIMADCVNDVNSAFNGGLHGIRHFVA